MCEIFDGLGQHKGNQIDHNDGSSSIENHGNLIIILNNIKLFRRAATVEIRYIDLEVLGLINILILTSNLLCYSGVTELLYIHAPRDFKKSEDTHISPKGYEVFIMEASRQRERAVRYSTRGDEMNRLSSYACPRETGS